MFPWRRTLLTKQVLIQLDTDETFAGVMIAKRGPLLVLANVERISGAGRMPLDGQLVVERTRVAWTQVAG